MLPGETPQSLVAAPSRAPTGPTPVLAAPARPKRAGSGTESDAEARAESSAELLAAEIADLGPLTPDEERAIGERVEMSDSDKRHVIAVRRKLRGGTYFDLLGVDGSVGRRELKRAYFRMSKAFHPDRYYQKELGSFRPWLTEIFETLTSAFAVLSDVRQRDA
jgi:hypothetical protein